MLDCQGSDEEQGAAHPTRRRRRSAILVAMNHIGIDARMTYHRMGGISTTIRQLVAALEAIDTSDDRRYTIFHSRKMAETINTRFRRDNLWTPSHHPVERWALSAELMRHRLDVFHATDFIPPRFGARRWIASIYDLAFLHYPEFLTPESRRYYNGHIRTAARQADHILTISESSKRDIVQLLGVPEARVSVHLLAAGEAFLSPRETLRARVRGELKLPRTYYLFVGTFEPRKNIIGLLDAYAQLIARVPDAPPLVLAGNRGWLYEETLARIGALKLGERVLIREAVPQSALPALYAMACALVMPSFYEGFGLPALEAMACGTLPIVSDRSSLPEVVGEVGALVDPENPQAIAAAMERAWLDSTWAGEQSSAGLRRARGFTWEGAAQVALDTYQNVLER